MSGSEQWTLALTSAVIWQREPGVVANAKPFQTALSLPPGSCDQGWRELNGAVGEVRVVRENCFITDIATNCQSSVSIKS